MVFERDTFELIWRAAVGFAFFVLLITALTIKGQAQETGPSTKERANTEEENTKALRDKFECFIRCACVDTEACASEVRWSQDLIFPLRPRTT
jgi:hypothetical protein